MKKTAPFMLMVFLGTILASCGNVKEHSTNAPDTFQRSSTLPQGKVDQASIDGQWRTKCIVDLGKRNIYQLEFSFQNDLLLSRTLNYADENCATLTTEEERLSKFTIDTASDETVTLAETLKTYKLRAMTSIGNAALIAQKFCGTDQWTKGEFRFYDSGAACALNTKELYKIEIFGDQELHLNNCTTSTSTDCKTHTFTRITTGS